MDIISRMTITAAAFAIANSASAEGLEPDPSPVGGLPDAVFYGETSAKVAAKILDGCANYGWVGTDVTDLMVTCEHSASDIITYMISPRGSTFRGIARFTILEMDGRVRVRGTDTTVATNVFGQSQTYSGYQTHGMQNILMAAGGELTPGTRFEGNYLGISGEIVSTGKKMWGFKVTQVLEGYAGSNADLRPNDVVTSVNTKKFKNMDKFADLVRKPKLGEPIALTVQRGSDTLTLTALAEEKPPVPERTALSEPTPAGSQ